MLFRTLPCLLTGLGWCALARAEVEFPLVTVDQAKSLETTQLPVWQSRIPGTGSRLFYFEGEWSTLTQRINGLADGRERWRSQLLAAADAIVASPIPAYEPPAKKVTPSATLTTAHKVALSSAEEELWERPVGDSMVTLALAARLTGDGKYQTKLRETVRAACGYESWGKGPHPGMDLAAAHLARGMAVAYDWERPIFSSDEQQLIRDTIRQHVNTELRGLYGATFWATGYPENHNQVNAAAIGLCGLAFLGEIPEAGEWLAAAQLDFQHVAEYSNADGSSAEGASYWTYGASFALQYIEGTRKVTGADALYEAPAFRNGPSYRIGSATPGWDGLLPWGDATSRDFYGPQHLLYRFAAQYHSAAAQYAADAIPFPPQGGNDVLAWTLLWNDPDLPAAPPTALDYHAPVLDVVTTRGGWAKSDYLLSLKSGYGNRSHSHLDIGALIFSWGNEWLLLAPGYGRGKGDPGFWDRTGGRWDFLSNATESHSTLLINGRNQRSDPDARGTITHFLSVPGQCWSCADLTPVYEGVAGVERNVFHRRGDYFVVLDAIQAKEAVHAEWLAQVPPTVEAGKRRLTVRGAGGGLAISLLNGAADFAVHVPSSPKPDLPPGRQQTYAAAADGVDLRFAVLLQPLKTPGTAPLAANWVAAPSPSQPATVQVRGTGWNDTLFWGGAAAPLPDHCFGRSAPDKAPSSLSASLVAVREEGGEMVSLSAMALTALQMPGLSLSPASPIDLAVEPGAVPRSLSLTFSTPFVGQLVLPPGAHCLDAEGQPVTLPNQGPVSLPPGNYGIAY